MDDRSGNPWTTLATTRQYENPWIEVDEHEVLKPDGSPGIYGTVHYKHLAVGVLPIDDAGRVCLVGQYRYAMGRYSWEVPAGGGPLVGEPLPAAQRELREETGLVADEWREVLALALSNSTTDERAVAFLAWSLTQHAAAPEETKVLQLRHLPFAEAVDMIWRGEITDAISVALILKVKLMALEGELPAPLGAAMLGSV